MPPRIAFDCEEREVRLLQRLRMLERDGIDLVELSLKQYAILRKTDTRAELLDRTVPVPVAGHA